MVWKICSKNNFSKNIFKKIKNIFWEKNVFFKSRETSKNGRKNDIFFGSGSEVAQILLSRYAPPSSGAEWSACESICVFGLVKWRTMGEYFSGSDFAERDFRIVEPLWNWNTWEVSSFHASNPQNVSSEQFRNTF